jgi:hypothetical protein
MLHDIRDVGSRAIYPSLLQRLVEQPSCGTYEWLSRNVFLVSRLLTHEHYGSGPASGPENRLGSRAPQIACPAFARGAGQCLQ